MTKIKQLRGRIARNYCRSILWVDDEIRLDGDYDNPDYNVRYRNFFLPTSTALQAQGVLCQLQPVSETEDPDSEPHELDSVRKLSKVADAIILDWHLAGKDPRHSIELIRSLLEERETRFILILTQHSNAIVEFGNEFQVNGVDNNFHLGNGKHVAILQKPEVETSDFAVQILAAIDQLMEAAYPDYAHWAALEIAGSIKKFAPRWLESLPRAMDWALLSEYCHANESTAELLVENLLEDLAHCISPFELESVRTENCLGADWPEFETRASRFDEITDDKALSLLRLDQPPPEIVKSGLPSLFENKECELAREFLASQSEFNTFCENVSCGDINTAFILPGSVFKKQESTTPIPREIFVCVSQGCDCIRAKKLLFIRGKKESSTKLGSTIVEFQKNRYRFDAEGRNLHSLDIEEMNGRRIPKSLEKIGQLRAATTRRLASRFWNHATRSAVNLSAFTRAERSGE